MSLPKLPSILRNVLSAGPCIAPVCSRAVLSVSGSQAPEFLNGILASAIPKSHNRPFYSVILNAQGRVLYDLLVFTDHNVNGRPAYLLEYDSQPSDAPSLHDLLKRYVLRAKVKIRDASDEYDSWAAWGSSEDSHWETARNWDYAASGAIEPVWSDAQEDWPWGTQQHVMRDRRAVGMGHRLLVRKGDRPTQTSTHQEVTSDLYDVHRILHGVPQGAADIQPTVAFPMDSNLDVMGALDFRKGCYVGQELTVRTYHKGVVRKRTVPVVIQNTASSSLQSFPSGLEIRPSIITERPMTRPRGTGKLLSSTHGVGLALLRLEHVLSASKGDIELTFDSGSEENPVTCSIAPWWPDWWPHQK